MEGYYWRIVDAAAGRVLVCLCGVCRDRSGRWAVIACAADPGGLTRQAVVAPADGDRDGFGARAEGVLEGSAQRLSVRLGEDTWVEARLRPRVIWPRRAFGALGAAHLVPGLAQYWQPVVLSAEVDGEACIGGTHMRLDGAAGYAEKNWGPGFARRWWWGQAGAFPSGDVTVAFAGGPLRVLGATVAPTALVVRRGSEVLRFAPPVARAYARVSERRWEIQARSPRYALELEGLPGDHGPHLLPVPELGGRRVQMRSTQRLSAQLGLRLRRAGRTLVDDVSPLAGLELGAAAERLTGSRPAERPL